MSQSQKRPFETVSYRMFNPQLTFEVLKGNRVSLAEYYVMCTVAYLIFLAPAELARQSFRLAEGDPRGALTEQEHLQAVFSCIEKKWLKIIEVEYTKGDDVLEIGTVDFTPAGYSLFRRIIDKIFGERPQL
jgi:hypothetical protein